MQDCKPHAFSLGIGEIPKCHNCGTIDKAGMYARTIRAERDNALRILEDCQLIIQHIRPEDWPRGISIHKSKILLTISKALDLKR